MTPEEQKNIKIYNSWRAIKHTKKGKKAGFSDSWSDYKNFFQDVEGTYKNGLRLFRLDIKKPFGPNNFKWMTQSENHELNRRHNYIFYKGEEYSLRSLSEKYNIPFNGLKLRFIKWNGKEDAETIIFGKKRVSAREIKCSKTLAINKQRTKASKMISSYRFRDKRKNVDCDLDIDWVMDNIFNKSCYYCGDDENIGCDRIDNTSGHSKDNVLPCCYGCNIIRSNNFSVDEMLQIAEVIKVIKNNRKKKTV